MIPGAPMDKWSIRFMRLADHVASWSKDPSTKVGAVIVNPDRVVVGLGYNGFPRGVEDTPDRLDNRQLKYQLVVHAEANAILNATGSVRGCTLYVTPLFSCASCAKLIIQSGIAKIYAPLANNERWQSEYELAKQMYREAGVEWTEVIYEREPDPIDSSQGSQNSGCPTC